MFLLHPSSVALSNVPDRPGFGSGQTEQRYDVTVFYFGKVAKSFGDTTTRKMRLLDMIMKKKTTQSPQMKDPFRLEINSPVNVIPADYFVLSNSKFTILYFTFVQNTSLALFE